MKIKSHYYRQFDADYTRDVPGKKRDRRTWKRARRPSLISTRFGIKKVT